MLYISRKYEAVNDFGEYRKVGTKARNISDRYITVGGYCNVSIV